ncbi:MAG: hypothetical protein KDJ73_13915 [Notoacmeibacter sp.]|nr:hypothetical protein [Notoacmeibacter sp.]MCC0031579.1 hypothetical protein [Brucellaceae bacterium]
MIRLFRIAACAAALMAVPPAIAADDVRTEVVHFTKGANGTTVKGQIKGYGSVVYKIGASAGQTIRLKLTSKHGATYFNLYGPGKGPGDEALANSSMTDPLNAYEGALPANGDYSVSVYMMRSAARRDEVANYTMEIAIDGKAAAAAPSQDAKVAGTDFNATGQIPCAREAGQPMGQCNFGVNREGNGNGMITVFWPDGGSRVIFFEMNTPTSFDQSQADGDAKMTVDQNSDLYIVTIGGQRFEIPEAVMAGG